MKRFALVSGLLALVAPLALAQTSTWIPDKAHSEVGFSVVHMSLARVRGHFGPISGKIMIDESNLTRSSVNMTIDVTGVDSGSSMRDNDLKSSNYFDVARYPTATFVSTGIVRHGQGYAVTGNLTLHGITKPVVLQVDSPVGPVDGMGGKQHYGFLATTTINRRDFGLGVSYPAKIVGDEVNLTIDLDVVKQ
ncbi:MAG TPA: YceI family protein [Terracidiphilus sp.]|nr:YceI family protein [Terracidiphilus sp.]